MAWFRWRRSTEEPPKPPEPPVESDEDEDEDDEDDEEDEGDLDGVDIYEAVEQVQVLAQASEPVDTALLQARLADLLRDEGIEPQSPASFAAWSQDFSDLAWRQVALAAEMLASMGVGLEQGEPRPASALPDLYTALQAQVQGSTSVGIELLATSEVRAEEFVRRLAHAMGFPIEDETPEQSRRELEKLDYSVLLALANDARLSAEERMARLRVLQESQDSARRRGKW